MTADMSAGAVLRRAREERRESLRQAANTLIVAPSHLSRLERGEKGASRELLVRAADHYGIDPYELGVSDVPADILEILRNQPELIEEIRGRYGHTR